MCGLIPDITSFFPPYDNAGYPQDTKVKIYFNKAINLSDFADEEGFLKNISLKSGETNLLSTKDGLTPYYKNPYLENEDKTLVIPIVSGNYLIKDGTTKDIQCTLNLEGLTDATEGEALSFAKDTYTFTYCLNAKKDSTAPVLKTLNIARTEEDARNGTNLITMEEFSHYAAKANYGGDSDVVKENIYAHRVNKVWIYFEAEDLESGVDKLVIEEKLVYNTNAAKENGELYSYTYLNSFDSYSYNDCFVYYFQTPSDGVINLSFNLYDYSGNVNKKEIDLIKDTVCLFGAEIRSSWEKFYFSDENGYGTCKFVVYANPYINTNTPNYFIIDLDGTKFPESIFYENEESEYPIKISKMEYGSSRENLTTLLFNDLKFTEEDVPAGYTGKKYKAYTPEITYYASKDLIVILTTEDSIGNTLTSETVFPAAANIVYSYEGTYQNKTAWYFQTDTTSTYSLYYVYEDSDGNKTEPKAVNGTYFQGTSYIYSFNGSGLDDIADGIYYFYAVPASFGTGGPIIYLFGSPWVIYKNVTNAENTNTELSIPNFSITETHPLNEGNHHICVNLNKEELNQNLKYFVEYKNTDTAVTYFSNDFEFDIKTDYCNYEFRLMVQNEAGETVFSQPVTVDLTYDNVSPITGGREYYNILGNTCFFYFPYLKDDGIGLKTNDKGEIEVKYITSPVALDVSEIDWDSNVQTTYNDEFYKISCPFDGGNGKYIYMYFEDKNGNFCTWQTYAKDYLPAIPTVQNNNGTLTVNNAPVDSNNKSARYLTAFYLEDSEWNITEQIKKENIFSSYLSSTTHLYDLNLSDTEKYSFIKVNCYSQGIVQGPYAQTYLSYSDYTLYFYPQYYLEENFTCNLKSYLECADNEIAIFADKPVLVQTFYCTTNLGSSENILEWISYSNEANVVQKDESFTYKVPVQEIPDGKYYTTVIHFADGTKKMTPVRQK